MGRDPVERGSAIVESGRERVFGSESVVDGEEDGVGLGNEVVESGVVFGIGG